MSEEIIDELYITKNNYNKLIKKKDINIDIYETNTLIGESSHNPIFEVNCHHYYIYLNIKVNNLILEYIKNFDYKRAHIT